MNTAVYIRVSSYSQKSDSQRADIRRWLTAHGHDLNKVQWFEDRETGATLQRAGFMALQEAIFAGTVKTVVVWKLDRLARSRREGINTLSAWCESGVRVVSVTQQIDLSGTVGHLVAGGLFAIAEIELQNTRERQAAGIAAAKAKGVYKGRAKGTTKAKPRRAGELKQQGLTAPEIAQVLNVSERTVRRYLKALPPAFESFVAPGVFRKEINLFSHTPFLLRRQVYALTTQKKTRDNALYDKCFATTSVRT